MIYYRYMIIIGLILITTYYITYEVTRKIAYRKALHLRRLGRNSKGQFIVKHKQPTIKHSSRLIRVNDWQEGTYYIVRS